MAAFGVPHADLLSTSGNFTLGNVAAMAGLHDDTRTLQVAVPVQSGNSGIADTTRAIRFVVCR